MNNEIFKFLDENLNYIINNLDTIIINENIDIENYFKSVIFSSSGVRKIFAFDRDENSNSKFISNLDFILTYSVASSYVKFLKENKLLQSNNITIGADSRPTSLLLLLIIYFTFEKHDVNSIFNFILSGPEIMAFAKTSQALDGFFYITASHNPQGYNGFKFGLKNGVLNSDEITKVKKIFNNIFERTLNNSEVLIKEFKFFLYSVKNSISKTFYFNKRASESDYLQFLDEIVFGKNVPLNAKEQFIYDISQSNVYVAAEFNGSSRIFSVDENFMNNLGVNFIKFNDKPGEFVHKIVPEGESLEYAGKKLEEYNSTHDNKIQFIYVPDCDGDRGNIVFHENSSHFVISAQKGFALSVMAEVGYAFLMGIFTQNSKNAVVVNDCTSNMINELLKNLNVKVFRSETGEANVVSKAQELEAQGWNIRIIGEGSNGGNITRPSNTRDPLATLASFLKLLYFNVNGKNIYNFFAEHLNKNTTKEKPGISDYLNLLPSFITTDAFEENAVLILDVQNQATFKEKFEKNFLVSWEQRKNYLLEKYQIAEFKEFNYEGTKEIEGFGPEFRSSEATGGLKIQFYNTNNDPIAWLFFRKSKTEPIFRTLVDIKNGTSDDLNYFTEWLQSLLKQSNKD